MTTIAESAATETAKSEAGSTGAAMEEGETEEKPAKLMNSVQTQTEHLEVESHNQTTLNPNENNAEIYPTANHSNQKSIQSSNTIEIDLDQTKRFSQTNITRGKKRLKKGIEGAQGFYVCLKIPKNSKFCSKIR